MVSNTPPNNSKHDRFFSPVRDLISALEKLRHELAADSSQHAAPGTQQVHLLKSVETSGNGYEIAVWDVLMPHLIRNAPKLAPDTVTALQDNHQIEKQLLELLKLHAGSEGMNDEVSQARVLASVNRLVGVLRGTLRILECEVRVAFDDLPGEQRDALMAVMDNELVRVDSGETPSVRGVTRAMDVLDTDRSSPPILGTPHAP
jgi:hypothetical protein